MKKIAIILTCALLILACSDDSQVAGNSVCSDNPGTCLSSPACVGEWVGTECRIGGTKGICTDIKNPDAPILQPCCSCNNSAGEAIPPVEERK